jgi:5-carboxymethyl-2-hydroxymuconate isomerase
MPHIVIEYSEGAGNRIDIPALVKAVHRSVRDSGAVKPNAVRTFAREATHSLVADEHSANQLDHSADRARTLCSRKASDIADRL